MGALHRLLGAVLPELRLRQSGDDDGKLVGRQRIGVMQHRRDRQVLASDRAVDDHLQPLDRGEDVDGAPISAGAIVIEDQHHTGSSTFDSGGVLRELLLAEFGTVFRDLLPDAGRMTGADIGEERLHRLEAGLAGGRGQYHLRQRSGSCRAHEGPRGNQVGEVERRNGELFCLLHHRRRSDRYVRPKLVERREVLLERSAVLDDHAFRGQPFAIGFGPRRPRAGGSDIADIGAALDEKARDQELGALVAGQRDAAVRRALWRERL